MPKLPFLKKTAKSPEEDSFLLCLKCRKVGHIVNNCREDWAYDELGWVFSNARRAFKVAGDPKTSEERLCERCQQIDLVSILHESIPWKSRHELNAAEDAGSEQIHNLGQVGTLKFLNYCSVCRSLFGLTPNPSSAEQEILIFPNWTMFRLEGGIHINSTEKQHSSKCILATLRPSAYTGNLNFEDIAARGDALCLLTEDEDDRTLSLGGRTIDSQEVNLGLIKEWLSLCDRLHPVTCSPVWDDSLQNIRFIDVNSRVVVKHPGVQCAYFALSYVWGDVQQQSFQLGSVLPTLPQTIEDAVTLVRNLGQKYLWVDSVCIDQLDDSDKLDQIGRMGFIYSGAYATIIALSGHSAESGLPRVSFNKTMVPQLQSKINGKHLVGLMPTLSQQVFVSPWGSRAWTLQEALLSRRCLYISDYQVYFECNAMQCSESIDQSRSWVHNTPRDAEFTKGGHSEELIGAGVLRSPFIGESTTNDRLQQYSVLVNLYKIRKLTNGTDALNAFSGILQYLQQEEYPRGFFWGLPLEDFNWGLFWEGSAPSIERRKFPSWSWATWDGAISLGWPDDIRNPHQYEEYLQVWKVEEEKLVQLYKTPPPTKEDADINQHVFVNDPVTKLGHLTSEALEPDLRAFPTAAVDGFIYLEGVVFEMALDFSKPQQNVSESGRYEYFKMSVRGSLCYIQIMSKDAAIGSNKTQLKRQCLLLARNRGNGWIYHKMMLLSFNGDVARRETAFSLMVPEDRLEIMEEWEPQMRRIMLS